MYYGDQEVETKTVIISTGSSAKLIGIESEIQLMGHGVSTCATCDGFFFRGKEIAVVGGGDSAMEEATFLTKFATKVSLIHRRDTLRASKIMQDRALKNPKIKFVWNTVVEEVVGSKETGVTGLKLRNLKTQETSQIKLDGLFIAIGHNPNTEIFRVRSISMNMDISTLKPIPRGRTFRECSPAATCRIRFSVRRSRRPGRAAWPRSKRNAG